MVSFQNDVERLAAIFGAVEGVSIYHGWRFAQVPPYGIWEGPRYDHFQADGLTIETAPYGFVHLFTRDDADPFADAITTAMGDAHMVWELQDCVYEDETNLWHLYWSWSWARG